MQDPHQPHTSTPEELQALENLRNTGDPFLAWRNNTRALQLMPLHPASILLIGRKAPADITLAWDAKASAPHAQLSLLGAGWFIEDLGSKNGTFVAGKRIWNHTRLQDHMRISAGQTILVFHHQQTRAPQNTAISETDLLDDSITRREDLRHNEELVLIALCRPLICDREQEPPPNATIAAAVFLAEDTVRRILTHLYQRFAITDEPKRRRLAQRAVATGVVTLDDYR